MLTRKTSSATTPKTGLAKVLSGVTGATVDRRTFLQVTAVAGK